VLTVEALWVALGQPATDYTAFVHVLDAEGKQVTGYDRAPAGDRFPTPRWRAGDRILSRFEISLPTGLASGTYEVWIGLYESESAGTLRLPVSAEGTVPMGDGQVRAAALVIE